MITKMHTRSAPRFHTGRPKHRKEKIAKGSAGSPARPRGKFVRPLSPPKASEQTTVLLRTRDLEELIEEE